MPRAIADSDNEDEDLDLAIVGQDDTVILQQGSQNTNGEIAINDYDGANEQSTGSTGTSILISNLVSQSLIVCRASQKADPEC